MYLKVAQIHQNIFQAGKKRIKSILGAWNQQVRVWKFKYFKCLFWVYSSHFLKNILWSAVKPIRHALQQAGCGSYSAWSIFWLNIHDSPLESFQWLSAMNWLDPRNNSKNAPRKIEVKATKFYIFENVVYRCRTHKPS